MMAASSSQSGATSSSVPPSDPILPTLGGTTTSPVHVMSDFTDADFLDKPLSYKVTHPLPPVPESMRLNGLNFLKWQRFVETTLRSRQLFKHCTGLPLTVTHPHYAAWDVEEQFILGWFMTHSLTPEFHDRFPHQKTVKGFWDQAHHFCGRGGDYWILFSLISRAHALRQGSLSISEYALAHQNLWDEVDHYLPTDDPKCRSYQNTLLSRLLGFLNGLNREYDDIRRRALRCKDGFPKLADLVKKLQEEESHFLLHGCPPSGDHSRFLCSSHANDLFGYSWPDPCRLQGVIFDRHCLLPLSSCGAHLGSMLQTSS